MPHSFVEPSDMVTLGVQYVANLLAKKMPGFDFET